jgi:hypothetical protein
MRILLLGEALVDLICERPVDGLTDADAFVPHFGGAVANVAVGAARQGAQVELAGGAGDDAWGGWLRDRLASEGVGLTWFGSVADVVTPVAFVTVDVHGEPSYAIYGDSIQAIVGGLEDTLLGAVAECDALFFTSNTLVGERERALTLAARDRALELGKHVVVDPNLRLHRWDTPARAGVGGARPRQGRVPGQVQRRGGAPAHRRGRPGARGRGPAGDGRGARRGDPRAEGRAAARRRDEARPAGREGHAGQHGRGGRRVLRRAARAPRGDRLLPAGDRGGAARRGRGGRARRRALGRAVSRVRRLRSRLRDVYGTPVLAPHHAPLDELVLTVLSQSTNDRNRDVAFLRLRERFGDGRHVDWEAVRAAPVDAVEEAIRPGGISEGQVGAHPADPRGDRRGRAGSASRRPRRPARYPRRATG